MKRDETDDRIMEAIKANVAAIKKNCETGYCCWHSNLGGKRHRCATCCACHKPYRPWAIT